MEVVLTRLVAGRGWQVYGKTAWQTPKKGQKLFAKREEDEALIVDEYSVAWMMKSKAKPVADVMGHVPQEISRFVFFFLKHVVALTRYLNWKSINNRLSQREAWR